MGRSDHQFQFAAAEIAKAAGAEAEYHEHREKWWQAEMNAAFETVKKTAKVTIQKQVITGGWRPDVVVDYGDPSAYRRMQESASKVQSHQKAAEQFRGDEKLHGTQGDRRYDLSTSDVHCFRLGGGPREE